MKHTASPWSIADDGRGNYHLEGATPGETVIALLCPRKPGEEPAGEDWSNWRLMRESPALAEALATIEANARVLPESGAPLSAEARSFMAGAGSTAAPASAEACWEGDR